MKLAVLPIALFLAVAVPNRVRAQSTEIEKRMQALEEQVKTLQAEITKLREGKEGGASPGPTTAPPPAETPSALSGAPTGGAERPDGPLPISGGGASKPFNPDIGMIGNFIGASGRSLGGSDSLAPQPSFTLQESEMSVQAIVDPYARADFFLAIGQEGIEVEEGYITFPTLPGGLLMKAGKMRATFGRLNAFHNHTLPWIDRPLVMYNLLGGSADDPDTGIKDAGISVSRLIPAGKLFIEATGELLQGKSGTLFHPSRRLDLGAVGHLRAYSDLTEATNLEAGGSYARGHNDAGSQFLTQLYGLDLTLRWRPLRRAIYHSFAGRTELIWSERQEPTGTQRAFGGFVSADYRVNRRWFLGGRYDWAERARQADIRDKGLSAVLSYWPSEFTQVRSQYRRNNFGGERVANELLFQILFTIGAHGSHPF